MDRWLPRALPVSDSKAIIHSAISPRVDRNLKIMAPGFTVSERGLLYQEIGTEAAGENEQQVVGQACASVVDVGVGEFLLPEVERVADEADGDERHGVEHLRYRADRLAGELCN
jgi:hypothetical protein